MDGFPGLGIPSSQGNDTRREAAVNDPEDVDECTDRLHGAGWSIGEVLTNAGWRDICMNGENILRASGATQRLAWQQV